MGARLKRSLPLEKARIWQVSQAVLQMPRLCNSSAELRPSPFPVSCFVPQWLRLKNGYNVQMRNIRKTSGNDICRYREWEHGGHLDEGNWN